MDKKIFSTSKLKMPFITDAKAKEQDSEKVLTQDRKPRSGKKIRYRIKDDRVFKLRSNLKKLKIRARDFSCNTKKTKDESITEQIVKILVAKGVDRQQADLIVQKNYNRIESQISQGFLVPDIAQALFFRGTKDDMTLAERELRSSGRIKDIFILHQDNYYKVYADGKLVGTYTREQDAEDRADELRRNQTHDYRGYKTSDQIYKGFQVYKSGKAPAEFTAVKENLQYAGSYEDIKKQIDEYWDREDAKVLKQKTGDADLRTRLRNLSRSFRNRMGTTDETDFETSADYFCAGTGFPPDHLEGKLQAEMKTAAEKNDGDLSLLDDEIGEAGAETTDKQVHAPKGGVTVKGKKFAGGEFIPAEGGYQEAYEKQKKEKEKPETTVKELAPAYAEEKRSPQETPARVSKAKKEEKVRTPEEQIAYEKKIQKKKEWKAKIEQVTVGVQGEELTKDLSMCKQRRAKAKKFWLDNFKVDIDDPRTNKNGGFSPAKVIRKAMSNDAFKNLPMNEKITMVSEMQRKNLPFAYGDKNTVDQNMKQEDSLIFGTDTVRGCMNNCISCYACARVGGIQQMKFDLPVACSIDNQLIYSKNDIQKGLEEWKAKQAKLEKDPNAKKEKVDEARETVMHYEKMIDKMNTIKVDHTFLRIGVVGDPATNWKHTCDTVSKKLNGQPADSIVYVTKLQRIDGFDPKVIRNMQVSVDPLNVDSMKTTMDNIKKLKQRDNSLNIVLRIRSFDSKNQELRNNLMTAVKFANDNDLPVLETKMRYPKVIANMMEMNLDSYHRPLDKNLKGKGTNMKANHNFLSDKGWDSTTNSVFKNPDNPFRVNKHLECDPKLTGCENCGNCVNVARQNYPWKNKQQ